jgi:hypothetical protein
MNLNRRLTSDFLEEGSDGLPEILANRPRYGIFFQVPLIRNHEYAYSVTS